MEHAVKCYSISSAAGWTGSSLQQAWLLRAAPQRYGLAKFDKVKSHLPESAAVSPCRIEMNFSSASFDFFPKIKSTELWHKMKSASQIFQFLLSFPSSFFPIFSFFLWYFFSLSFHPAYISTLFHFLYHSTFPYFQSFFSKFPYFSSASVLPSFCLYIHLTFLCVFHSNLSSCLYFCSYFHWFWPSIIQSRCFALHPFFLSLGLCFSHPSSVPYLIPLSLLWPFLFFLPFIPSSSYSSSISSVCLPIPHSFFFNSALFPPTLSSFFLLHCCGLLSFIIVTFFVIAFFCSLFFLPPLWILTFSLLVFIPLTLSVLLSLRLSHKSEVNSLQTNSFSQISEVSVNTPLSVTQSKLSYFQTLEITWSSSRFTCTAANRVVTKHHYIWLMLCAELSLLFFPLISLPI